MQSPSLCSLVVIEFGWLTYDWLDCALLEDTFPC